MSVNKNRQKKKFPTQKSGLPPGSLVYVGNLEHIPTTFRVVEYGKDCLREHNPQTPEQCIGFKEGPNFSWINITGLGNAPAIGSLGKIFGLHDLLSEDILNTTGRPKLEKEEQHLFTIVKMAWLEGDRLHFEHVCLVMGKNWVLTFQEIEGDVFGKIRERMLNPAGRIRNNGPDYLFYALLDAIVDNFFVVLEHIGEQLEDFEVELAENFDHSGFVRLQVWRKELIRLRKSVYPLREVVGGLHKSEHHLIQPETEKYLRDLYDHSIQVIETVETFRDLQTSLLDIYMSGVSARMNNIMKVLTIIATIFIPLTFIAGVYGMNFENMPELNWEYGYFYTLALMGILSMGMLAFFRKMKWF